jgi:S1-C subfamily serine protease
MRPRCTLVALLALLLAGCATGGRSQSRGDVIRQILPATVQLRCERDGGGRRAASGVVLARDVGSRRAWIVTTRHFLEPLAPQTVFVAGRKERISAKLVTVSQRSDLALLEVPDVDLAPARLKDNVQLGDEVWVVAFPWGRRMTLSSGVVSQVAGDGGGGDYEGAARMVDVSVSYGASGGGVFDAQTGALVGLIESYRTARVSMQGSPERVIDVPVPGETTLISADAIRGFLAEAGLERYLEQ